MTKEDIFRELEIVREEKPEVIRYELYEKASVLFAKERFLLQQISNIEINELETIKELSILKEKFTQWRNSYVIINNKIEANQMTASIIKIENKIEEITKNNNDKKID